MACIVECRMMPFTERVLKGDPVWKEDNEFKLGHVEFEGLMRYPGDVK